MKTLQHTLLKLLPLTVGVATLFISCSHDEDAAQDGGRRELAVDVQMTSSDWTTRSGADGTHDRTQVLGSVALDEQLEIAAECEPIGYTPETPLTRGTPVGSASDLQSMGIPVYTNSTFAKTLTATNNSGSWVIANNIGLDLDKNKYSYYAYAPVATDDNGIVLTAGAGADKTLTLTYTAPDDITKQPDLCWATPILDDQSGTVTFAMQHALTAVGVKVRADKVEIQSIKLLGVNTSGTLDLIKSAWTGRGAAKDLSFPLSTNKPATGNDEVNITPSDGYLMLPPQTLTGDSKKLVIVYKYDGETTWRTGTHLLSSIAGGDWLAGQKVSYVIQLKANFALDLGKYSGAVTLDAGSYTLKYTTGSLASSDPRVSRPSSDTWITSLTANRGAGTITFNYSKNTASMARQSVITVTSGFTTKTFAFKQLSNFGIDISAKTPPGTVYRNGGSYTTTVTTPSGVAWKVSEEKNCSVSPKSGLVSGPVTITVSGTTSDRDLSVTFSTNMAIDGIAEKTVGWSGKQTKAPEGTWPTPLPGTNVYVLLDDSGFLTYTEATNACNSVGGRLPSIEELKVIYTYRASYGFRHSVAYRSSEPGRSNCHKCWHFSLNVEHDYWQDSGAEGTRCVKDLPK